MNIKRTKLISLLILMLTLRSVELEAEDCKNPVIIQPNGPVITNNTCPSKNTVKGLEELLDIKEDELEKILEKSLKHHKKRKEYLIQEQTRLNQLIANESFLMGVIEQERKNFKEALIYFENASKMMPKDLFYQNQAGIINWELKNLSKSIRYFESSFESAKDLLGKASKADFIRRIPELFRPRNQKTMEYFEIVLFRDSKKYGKDHFRHLASHRKSLMEIWRELDKAMIGIEKIESSLDFSLTYLTEDNAEIINNRFKLGYLWFKLGKYKEAIKYYELALINAEKRYKNSHSKVKEIRIYIAEARKEMVQENN